MDVSGLFSPEEIPRAPDLEIFHGKPETCSEITHLLYCLKPFFCLFGNNILARYKEIRIGPHITPSHTTPELIKLGKPHHICPVNDDSICFWDVKTGTNDGSCYKYVDLSHIEFEHDFFEFFLWHLSMCNRDFNGREESCKIFSKLIDIPDPIMNKKYLAVPFEFSRDSIFYKFLIKYRDNAFDSEPLLRGSFDYAHFSDIRKGHMKCPRYWRRSKGEDINSFFEFFYPFFLPDANPVFLINDKETKFIKMYTLSEEAMGPNNNVYIAP